MTLIKGENGPSAADCPFCGADLTGQKKLPQHLPKCPDYEYKPPFDTEDSNE